MNSKNNIIITTDHEVMILFNIIDYRHECWDIDSEDVVRELPLELEIFQFQDTAVSELMMIFQIF